MRDALAKSSCLPMGTKAPGYKVRQTRGNAISVRGGLSMRLARSSSSFEPGWNKCARAQV